MKPSRSRTSGDGTPAPGCSTCDTATLFTRIWPALSQHPIAGSRCALSECWIGTHTGLGPSDDIRLLCPSLTPHVQWTANAT
jgi:hypothetical protein